MKIIYVAGKYTGQTHGPESYVEISRNILTAREWAIKIMELGNCVTFTPHLNSAHMEIDCKKSAEFWYEADLEILRRCDAVFLLPNWKESVGAKKEREVALASGMPVFEDLADLKYYLRHA